MTGHIIVVDPVVGNRILLRGRLLSAYYTVEAFESPESLAIGDHAARADLIFLADTPQAREILRLLRSDPGTAHVPVILTGAPLGIGVMNPGEARARGVGPGCKGWLAGADDVLPNPLADPALFARLRMLISLKRLEDDVRAVDPAFASLPMPTHEQTRTSRVVLLFDPCAGPGTMDEPARLCAMDGRHCAQMDRESQVHSRVLDCPDTAVVLWMNDEAHAAPGLRVLAHLRADPLTRLTPVLAVVPAGDTRLGAQAMELGACDAIALPNTREMLPARLRAAERRMQRAAALRAALVGGMRLALTDPMTGLYNRRHVLAAGPQLLNRSLRNGRPFAVIMLDIDHFKAVNDTYGHNRGDTVLKTTARRMKQAVRPNDTVARIGGEEFLIALPATSGSDALKVAERVRLAIAARPINLGGAHAPLPVTISAGVADLSGNTPVGHGPAADGTAGFDALVERADRALYACKRQGRNRTGLAAPLAENGRIRRATLPGSPARP